MTVLYQVLNSHAMFDTFAPAKLMSKLYHETRLVGRPTNFGLDFEFPVLFEAHVMSD